MMRQVKPLRPGLLPVIMLVVIIGWALFAVLMLTGTLISAQQIEDRVTVINAVYPRVDQNLKSVPLALETGRLAAQIGQAAKPVGPQFTQIVGDVGGIQNSVTSVLDRATQINNSVKTINVAVRSINATVLPIASTLASVDSKARSINDSVHGINDRFGHVLDHVHDIRDRVVRINVQAYAVRDQAREIKDNTGRLVSPLLPDILRNSYAISRSPVVNLLGRGSLNLNGLLSVLRPGPVPRLPVQLPGLLTGATAPDHSGSHDAGPRKDLSHNEHLPSLGGLLGN